MSVKIIGTGSYVPERILTNDDLSEMVDTSDEWISTRTGIKERHIAADDQATSDLALGAAKNALAAANVRPAELDLIIVATVTPDKAFPSTACILQHKLGAGKCACFDLEAACSGLLYSLELADAMLKTRPAFSTALVIGAEKLTSLVDWEDRGTCVLFGDGAGALVLRGDDAPDSENSLISGNLGADGDHKDILQVPAGGSAMPITAENLEQRAHYMKMEGQEVFKLAVNAMVKSCKDALADAGMNTSQVRWLIPHQANLRILKMVGNRLKIPVERIYINVDRFGNTSAASIGIALDELVRSGDVQKGDHLLLTAFGGGLTWGSLLIRW